MTKEELAALLHGRQYSEEITKREEQQAKESGLVVIFGYSDDNVEFRGVINDEVGCYGGGKILFDSQGHLPSWEYIQEECTEDEAKQYFVRKAGAHALLALWNDADSQYGWSFATTLPHATFDIMEADEPFCRGIVIDVRDL